MQILLYVLFFVAVFASFVAQINVSTTFRKYSKTATLRAKTGKEVAEALLRMNGITDVSVESVRGNLTDHYDPRAKVLRLSNGVYSSSSASAIGVASHEVGHAIQHSKNYLPIKIRSILVPITNFSSSISWLVIMAGLVISLIAELSDIGYYVILIGIGLFSTTALFQLVTLPCEFNASKRAMQSLRDTGWYSDEELTSARRVLNSAAMTYVASLFVSIIQVLRLLLIFGRRRRR